MIPQDILQSNRDLTPEERHSIKQLAQDTDAKLKAVTIATEPTEVEELLETAKNCRLALAPIRALPRDVVCEIFRACVRGDVCWMSPNEAPLLLTYICTAFRDIALSMPTLWAAFSFYIHGALIRDDDDDDDDEDEDEDESITRVRLELRSQVDVIEKWIHRSGTLPLSIKCGSYVESDMVKHFEEELYALEEVLLRSANRWQYLSLGCNGDFNPFERIMDVTPDKILLLTTLDISIDPFGENIIPGNILQARNLTKLNLIGTWSAKYHVNWSQLTQLTLTLYTSVSIAEILRQTENLVQLSLENSNTTSDIDDIHLPHLRELKFLGAPLNPAHLLVATHIYAPALETLHADDGEVLFTNLLERSPRLRNLEIRIHYPHALGAWLRNCPQITSLVMKKIHPGPLHIDELLEVLRDRDRETHTCRNPPIFRYDGVPAAPFTVLCQFLGAEHGRSDAPLSREWEHISLIMSV